MQLPLGLPLEAEKCLVFSFCLDFQIPLCVQRLTGSQPDWNPARPLVKGDRTMQSAVSVPAVQSRVAKRQGVNLRPKRPKTDTWPKLWRASYASPIY